MMFDELYDKVEVLRGAFELQVKQRITLTLHPHCTYVEPYVAPFHAPFHTPTHTPAIELIHCMWVFSQGDSLLCVVDMVCEGLSSYATHLQRALEWDGQSKPFYMAQLNNRSASLSFPAIHAHRRHRHHRLQ